MFESLKADSYEQALAGQSLEDLDAFYALIFEPGASLNNELAAKCPRWPEGTRCAGDPPSKNVLIDAHCRFRAEHGLELLARQSAMGEACLKSIKALPEEEQLKLLDKILTMMINEVMAGNLAGVPVSAQLPPVDRLLARQKLGVRRGDLKVKRSRLKLEERKVKALEKKCEGNKEPEQQITKEGWEQVERNLKLL
jgi:hypothetical protein